MRISPLLPAFALLLAAPASAQLEIVNGDAEADPGGNGTQVISATGWTQTGDFTVTLWNNPGWMLPSDPGPVDRGLNYFSGGLTPLSTAEQTIDVSAVKSDIDAGAMGYWLNGWLGGWQGQSDQAIVYVDFLDANGSSVGVDQIGPVTPAMRGSATGLMEQNATGTVPSGTRSVHVLIELSIAPGSPAGYYNDGYADNIEMLFIPNGGPRLDVGEIIAGQPVTLEATGATPNGQVRFAYSLTGGGPLSTGLGTLLLSQPYKILGDAAVNASGEASYTANVPAVAAGRTVHIQCADIIALKLSNGRVRDIQ